MHFTSSDIEASIDGVLAFLVCVLSPEEVTVRLLQMIKD